MSVSLLTSDVEQLVSVVQAKAGYERRKIEDEEVGTSLYRTSYTSNLTRDIAAEDGFETVIATLMEGIGKVRAGQLIAHWLSPRTNRPGLASKTGDPQLRLEKYFSSLVCSSALHTVASS